MEVVEVPADGIPLEHFGAIHDSVVDPIDSYIQTIKSRPIPQPRPKSDNDLKSFLDRIERGRNERARRKNAILRNGNNILHSFVLDS